MIADERELYELLGDEVVVDGITYRKRPYVVPGTFCWDGGPVGGIVSINWLNSVKKIVDQRNPWKGGVYSCKTFERAAICSRKHRKQAYEEAKKVVAAYEGALK